jgi:ribosomal-protein-alanine N-acetyltransferase
MGAAAAAAYRGGAHDCRRRRSCEVTRQVTVSWGADQFRFGPWHGDASTAYVTVSPRVRQPTSGGVGLLVERLASNGFNRVVTAALRNHEVPAFAAAGFTERERLVVLSHDLRQVPPSPPIVSRRAHRSERDEVLRIDGAAFDPAWALDAAGLTEAIGATPHSRFRVVESRMDRRILAGYAICGRSGRIGYLQRLAVDPAAQGDGVGRAMVIDALAWVRRRNGRLVMVNTQQSNSRALELYRGLGFRTEPSELTVLTFDLAS